MNLHTFEKSNFEKPALINERLLLPQAYFPMHTDQGHSEGMTAAAAVTLAPHRSTDSLSNGQGSDFQVYSPLAVCKRFPLGWVGAWSVWPREWKLRYWRYPQVICGTISSLLAYTPHLFGNHDYKLPQCVNLQMVMNWSGVVYLLVRRQWSQYL